jgi:hypothetical protein
MSHTVTDYKAKLEMLLEMSKAERLVYLINETVVSEQAWLAELLQVWREDRSVTMEEIRDQRRRVQVWLRRLNEAKQKLAKSE